MSYQVKKDICKACGEELLTGDEIGKKDDYSLLRCKRCQTVTVSPFPTEEELIAFYQEYRGTPGYSAKKEKKIRRAKKRIKKILRYARGKKFLDVGCNAGFTVEAAQQLGLDSMGIDVDCEAYIHVHGRAWMCEHTSLGMYWESVAVFLYWRIVG